MLIFQGYGLKFTQCIAMHSCYDTDTLVGGPQMYGSLQAYM